MNRRNYLKSSLVVAGNLILPTGALALVGCGRASRSSELTGFDGKIMGTGYSVRLSRAGNSSSGSGSHSVRHLAQQIHSVLQDVDAHMSTWRTDSEVSAFNNSTNTDWQVMSPATTSVIAQAHNISDLSAGAFDLTVGPLVDLWGFGAGALKLNKGGSYVKPAASGIREALTRVGFDAIDISSDNNVVRKRKPRNQIDLSGIAKGHAVDCVANELDSKGIESYLVEVGGELRSRGRKPDGSLWRVAIEQPNARQRDVFRILKLDNQAVATSGNYRNFFDHGGQRYSHAIDPRTGESVSHQLASVSVVAKTTLLADAFSTAMMVMGPDTAIEFAQKHHIAAHLILKSDAGLKEFYSSEFEPLLV